MNTETSLIIRNDAALTVSFTDQANELKEAALNAGALVGRVTNADEQAAAVEAQMTIQAFLKLVDKAEELAKRPLNDLRAEIIAKCREFKREPSEAMTRVSTLVGSYQQAELARQRAELQAQNEKLLEIEREKAKALVQAKTEAEVDAVQEHFNNKAAVVAPPPAEPARVEGQRVTTDWEITVTDIHELYRFHANCVKLEPRLSEIKELLKRGVTPRGVVAKPIVKAGVRVSTERAAIEV